jgi:flagellar motility protein MotE (MotC chaperone)
MWDKIRLLPIVIVCCAAVLFIRIENIFAASEEVKKEEAKKEESKKEEPKKEEAKKGEKPADPKADAKAGDKPAEAGKDEKKPEGDAAKAEADAAEKKDAADAHSKSEDPVLFNDSELDILQSLSERRDQLNAREQQLEQKESLLQVAEQRIDQKLTELKEIKGEIETARADIEKMMKMSDAKDNQRIQDLVKTYEGMKPKDAAKIFDLLDMPVLMEVIGQMKGAKMGPVLASMDPSKAKAVTIELAKRHQLPDLSHVDAKTQAAAPPETKPDGHKNLPPAPK